MPHCEKPPQVVAKRNARERRRVQAVNQAFIQLRKAIPIESKVKKIKMYQITVDYTWNHFILNSNILGMLFPCHEKYEVNYLYSNKI